MHDAATACNLQLHCKFRRGHQDPENKRTVRPCPYGYYDGIIRMEDRVQVVIILLLTALACSTVACYRIAAHCKQAC